MSSTQTPQFDVEVKFGHKVANIWFLVFHLAIGNPHVHLGFFVSMNSCDSGPATSIGISDS